MVPGEEMVMAEAAKLLSISVYEKGPTVLALFSY
jgi:hypothetical protein